MLLLARLTLPLKANCNGALHHGRDLLELSCIQNQAVFDSDVYSCKRNVNPCSPILSSWQKKSPFTFKTHYKKWAQIKSLDSKPLSSLNDRIQTQSLLVGPLTDVSTSLINTHRCSVKIEGLLGLSTDMLIYILLHFHPCVSCINNTKKNSFLNVSYVFL